MAEVVNLRMVRKQKARAEKEKTANENRTLHGMTKAERDRQKTVRDRERSALDGHRRDVPTKET